MSDNKTVEDFCGWLNNQAQIVELAREAGMTDRAMDKAHEVHLACVSVMKTVSKVLAVMKGGSDERDQV